MNYKELNIKLELPSAGDKWCIEVRLSGFDTKENCVDWLFSSISWKTYCEIFADNIVHYLYDVWLTTDNDDMLEMLDKLKQIIVNKL